MLHNILLKAGVQTEVAKKGKFINVVLAGGEITARIRYESGGVFETKLVSGMSFPVNEGFVSVGFESSVSQQTKIWLGNIPLNYTPLEIKTVGSGALESRGVKTYQGQITELLPATIGRGKITLSALDDFFVGGEGINENNAIKVAAGSIFQMNTQARVLAFTDNPSYSAVLNGEVIEPFAIADTGVLAEAGSIDAIEYDQKNDRLIYVQSGDVKSSNTSFGDTQVLINKSSSVDSNPIKQNGKWYVLFKENAGYFSVFEYDLKTGENQVFDLGVASSNGLFGWSMQSDLKIAVGVLGNAYQSLIYSGVLGGALNNVTTPVEVNANNARGLIYCPNDDVIYYTDNHTFRSSDHGETWGEETISPFNQYIGCYKQHAAGNMYYSRFGLIYKSINNGVDWSLYVDVGAETTFTLFTGEYDYFGFANRFFYTKDGGENISEVQDGFDGSFSPKGICIANTGFIYFCGNGGVIKRSLSNAVLTGGLDVSVMSEIN
jgi:hypothetical protein